MRENMHKEYRKWWSPHLGQDMEINVYSPDAAQGGYSGKPKGRIIVCVGPGAWEDEMRVDAAELRRILDSKGVPAWIDFWGHDVNHDWPWWRVQMPYFLSKLG